MSDIPDTDCESCLHLSKRNGELYRENDRLTSELEAAKLLINQEDVEVHEALRLLLEEYERLVLSFVLDEIEYMTKNKLGDPERQHNVRWARRLGVTKEMTDAANLQPGDGHSQLSD